MNSKILTKQCMQTRLRLHEAKTAGETIDFATFCYFKKQLQDLKNTLQQSSKNIGQEKAIAALLQCFTDDYNLGTNGYDTLYTKFTDNKCTTGNPLLEHLAQHEAENPQKTLQRDYENYTQHPIEKDHLTFFDYQINHIIDAIFQHKSFDVKQILQI